MVTYPIFSGSEPYDYEDHYSFDNDTLTDPAEGSEFQVNWPKIVFTILICVVGLIGNIMSIFVIVVLKEYEKSITHMYVLQLAIADSAFLLTLPFSVSEEINDAWIYGQGMCKAKESLLFINYYSSILFLMVMSIDRYIAVCHTFSDNLLKLRKPFSATIIVITTWILSLIMCIPVMMYSTRFGDAPKCKCTLRFPLRLDTGNVTENCLNDGFTTMAKLDKCRQIHEIAMQRKSAIEYCRDFAQDEIMKGLFGGYGEENNGTSDYSDLYGGNASSGFDYMNGHVPFGAGVTAYDGYDEYGDENSELYGKQQPTETETIANVSTITNASSDYTSTNFGEPGHEVSRNMTLDHLKRNTIWHDVKDEMHQSCHHWDQASGWNIFIYFNFIVMFLVPLSVMIITYGLIIRKLRITTMRAPSTNKMVREKGKRKVSGSGKNKQRVTIMCFTLVVAFILCWLLFHASHLARIVGIHMSGTATEAQGLFCVNLGYAGALLAYMNSALNPYLYSFIGTNFVRRWSTAKNTVMKTVTSNKRHSSSLNTGVTYRKRSKDGSNSVVTMLTRIRRRQSQDPSSAGVSEVSNAKKGAEPSSSSAH